MKQREIRLAAAVLTGALVLGGTSFTSYASPVSGLLPAAGLALEMEEGSKQEEVKASTKSSTEKKETLFDSLAKDKDKDKDKSSDKNTSKNQSTQYSSSSSSNSKKEDTEIELPKSLSDSTKDKDKDKEKEKEEQTLIIEDSKTATAAKNAETAKAEKEKAEKAEMTEEEQSFTKLVIAKVSKYVNVRSLPSEDGEIVGKLYDKSVGEYITEANGWYKIKSGNVTGYVKGEFCVTGKAAVELAKKVGTRVATVTTTTLKVREEASTGSSVLGLVPIEEELSVIEEENGWVKVDIEEGYGYVSSDYVSLRTDFVKAESIEEEKARLKKEEEAKAKAKDAAKKAQERVSKQNQEKQQSQSSSQSQQPAPAPAYSSDGSIGGQVVDYAMQFVGNPYVYGGSSLTSGTDCSGFVMRVYENFGVSLPHSSSADRSQGYAVDGLANAKPGDLVCYSGHVALYAGNGKIVHASTSKTGIIVSNANYRNVLAVRRIF